MTDDDLKDKYPHWRDALFGNNDAVANIRCAIHYVFWHSVYFLIALVGLVVLGVVKIVKTISRPLGPLTEPIHNTMDQFVSGVNYVLNHDYTKKAFDALLVLFFAASVIVGLGFIGYMLITQFWLTIKTVGVIIAFFVAFGIGMPVIDKVAPYIIGAGFSAAGYTASKARDAGEKAVETPGVRRVYGQCPVSLDMAPKWFDNLFPEDEY